MSTLKGYNSNPKTLSGIVDVVADTAQIGGIVVQNDNIQGISNFNATDITCTNLTATTITGGTITYTTATIDDLVVNDSTLIDCDMNLTTGNSYNINNVDVLNSTTLGSSVVNSSLTSLGTLSSLAVSGNLTVDTNTLVVDATTNRVGIGTTPLNHRLEVDGTIDLGVGHAYRINNNIVISATGLGTGVVSSSLTSLGTLTALTVQGTANIVTGNFDDVNITNNLDVDGNTTLYFVGINTPVSAYPLSVGGDVNITLGNSYDINGTSVLDATTLGSSVVNSSLTSIGTLTGGCNIATGQAYKIAGSNRLTNDTIITNIVSPLTTGATLNLQTSGVLNYSGGEMRFNGSTASRILLSSVFQAIAGGQSLLYATSTGNRVGIVNTNPSYTLDCNGDINARTGYVYRINGTSVLSATALGTGVLTSSLVSVGTLTGLTVGGSISQTAGTASLQALTVPSISCSGNISGTLTTATQTNITSVGTLTGLTVGGSISQTAGTASLQALTVPSISCSGNISGTLTTASQPNITSLGTLSSLTVGGNITQTSGTASLRATGITGTLTQSGGLATLAETIINRPATSGAGNIVDFRYNNITEARIDENGNFYAQDGDFADLNVSNLCDVFNLQVNNDATLQSDLFFNSTTGVIQNVNDNIVKVSGNLRVDTSTLVVDATNDRVGVGVTTPAYKLEVDGGLNLLTGHDYRVAGTSVLNSTTLGSGVVNSSLTSVGTLTGGLNIASGQTYKINGTNVLSSTTLGSGITSSSLTSLGTLTSLTISGDLTVDTSTLKVDSTNNRVGVNTASPSTGMSLHVNGYIRTQAICCRVIIGIGGLNISPNTSMFDNGASVTFDLFPSALGSYGFIVTGAPWQGMYRAPISGYYRVSMMCRFTDGAGGTRGMKPVKRSSAGAITNIIGVDDGIVWCPTDGSNRRVACFNDMVYIDQGDAVFPTTHSTVASEWASMAINLVYA